MKKQKKAILLFELYNLDIDATQRLKKLQTPMGKIWYFGQSKNIFRLLNKWLGTDYHLVEASDPITHLSQWPNSDEPELMLIALSLMTPEDHKALFQIIEQSTAEQIPPIILISDQPSEKQEETIPATVWESEDVDILHAPISKQYTRKKVALAFKYKKSILARIQAEKKMDSCKLEYEAAVDRLKNSAQENEALLQEIHHRVKNNLQIVSSILSFKTQEIDDPRVQDILMIARSRIDAISLIHKKLYESTNLAKIKMHDYIRQQISDLFYNYPERSNDIELNIELIPFTLEVKPAIHCALLINELVINVLLHAFPDETAGHLRIRVENHQGNQLRLMVKDDGIGIRGNPEEIGTKSIGMRLIYQLTKQINGTVQYHADSGTCFEIIFPKSP